MVSSFCLRLCVIDFPILFSGKKTYTYRCVLYNNIMMCVCIISLRYCWEGIGSHKLGVTSRPRAWYKCLCRRRHCGVCAGAAGDVHRLHPARVVPRVPRLQLVSSSLRCY